MPTRSSDTQTLRAAPGSTGDRPPAVSVILPTYQRASLVGRAIRSVLAQTYADFELLVVDDGSTDATAAAVAQCADPRVRYLRLERNRGAGAARNAGVARSTGRVLAFQDSDDEWLPTKLESHLRALSLCGEAVGVVYSDMERIWRDGRVEYHRSPDIVPGVLIAPATRFYQVCGIGIQSAVIRRECLQAVGGFNEAFPALEDLELFIRLSQRYGFQHLERPLVRYYDTDGLSRNMPAKRLARTLMLQLYQRELERDDPGFLLRERAALDAAVPVERSAARRT